MKLEELKRGFYVELRNREKTNVVMLGENVMALSRSRKNSIMLEFYKNDLTHALDSRKDIVKVWSLMDEETKRRKLVWSRD